MVEKFDTSVENKEALKEAIYLGCSGGAVDFFAVGDAVWEIELGFEERILPACDCCMSYSIKKYVEEHNLRIPSKEEEKPNFDILKKSRNKIELMELEKNMILKIESMMEKGSFSDAEVLSKLLGFSLIYDENNAVINICKNSEVIKVCKIKDII